MTSSASLETAEVQAAPSGSHDGGRRAPGRRRKWVLAAVVLVMALGAALGVSSQFKSTGPTKPGASDKGVATSLASVTREELSSQTQVAATLGYAGSYSAVNQAQGTITSLPSTGQIVAQGQVLYGVSGNPVVLLYGPTPAYRSLSEGAPASDATGADVQEINADLVALGYVTGSELSPTSNEFSYWTKVGVEKLQAALGETQNGTLALGQAVFLPSAARVTAVSATLGAPAQPGAPVLTATSITRQVTIALDAAQQSEIKVGDNVTITLPNNQTTPGVVSSVGTVATAPASGSSNSTPTIAVDITPTDPAATGNLDQAPVTVSITTASVKDALVVPVDGLLALAGGRYAVEVVSSAGLHSLVPVTLGLFDDADGLVAVTGSGLAAGQRVVVPAR
jgi:hypothetical protein